MQKTTIGFVALAILALLLGGLFVNTHFTAKNLEAQKLASDKALEDAKAAQELQRQENQRTAQALNSVLTKIENLEKDAAVKDSKILELGVSLEETTLNAQKSAAEREDALKEIAELKAQLNNPTQGVSTVVGEIIDSLYLNDVVNFVVDDQDVPELLDGTIEFDGTDYDVHEEFRTVNGKVVLATSLTEDDEFGADARLTITDRESLVYQFVFDEPITVSDVSNDEPLKIRLLGQDVEFVKITSSEATIRSGMEAVLFEGDTTTVDGKTVKLELVGNEAAYVDVNGVKKVIREFRSEKVNGIDIRVEDILTNDDGPGMATLVLGGDTIYRQNNNDDFFDDESFVFRMDVVGGELKSITVTYDEKRTKVDGTLAALKTGEEVCFPNNFVCIKFKDLENTDYKEFRVTMDTFDEELANGVDINQQCALIEGEDDSSIEVGTTQELSEIYACVNSKVYYQDNDGDWFESSLTSVRLVNDEAEYKLAMGPNTSLRIVEPTGDYIQLDTDFAGERFGALDDEAEATDVKYNNINLGGREYDVLSLYGTVILDVENNLESEEVLFKIPSDRVEANVLVYSQ